MQSIKYFQSNITYRMELSFIESERLPLFIQQQLHCKVIWGYWTFLWIAFLGSPINVWKEKARNCKHPAAHSMYRWIMSSYQCYWTKSLGRIRKPQDCNTIKRLTWSYIDTLKFVTSKHACEHTWHVYSKKTIFRQECLQCKTQLRKDLKSKKLSSMTSLIEQ